MSSPTLQSLPPTHLKRCQNRCDPVFDITKDTRRRRPFAAGPVIL